jgi:hypothetical protein
MVERAEMPRKRSIDRSGHPLLPPATAGDEDCKVEAGPIHGLWATKRERSTGPNFFF